MCLKVSSAKCRPFCLGLNVLADGISMTKQNTVNNVIGLTVKFVMVVKSLFVSIISMGIFSFLLFFSFCFSTNGNH